MGKCHVSSLFGAHLHILPQGVELLVEPIVKSSFCCIAPHPQFFWLAPSLLKPEIFGAGGVKNDHSLFGQKYQDIFLRKSVFRPQLPRGQGCCMCSFQPIVFSECFW